MKQGAVNYQIYCCMLLVFLLHVPAYSMEKSKQILRYIFHKKQKNKKTYSPLLLPEIYNHFAKIFPKEIVQYIVLDYVTTSLAYTLSIGDCIADIQKKNKKNQADFMFFIYTLLKPHNHIVIAEIVHLGFPEAHITVSNDDLSVCYIIDNNYYSLHPKTLCCTGIDIDCIKKT